MEIKLCLTIPCTLIAHCNDFMSRPMNKISVNPSFGLKGGTGKTPVAQATTTVRTRRRRGKTNLIQNVKVPPYLTSNPDDMAIVKVRTASVFTIPAGFGTAGSIIALTPRVISSTGYSSLGALMPLLSGMASNYNRFMVVGLQIRPVMISGYTLGGLVAVNFEADDSATSSPPSTLSDVTRAKHYAMSTPFMQESIEVQPQLYFNDWKNTTLNNLPNSIEQAGITQIYGTVQTAPLVNTDIAVIEIECEVYFEGLKYTP